MLKRLVKDKKLTLDNPNKSKFKPFILMGVLVVVFVLGYLIMQVMFHPKQFKVKQKNEAPQGIIKDSQFTEDDITSAQKYQQASIDKLEKALNQQSKTLVQLQNTLKTERERSESEKDSLVKNFTQQINRIQDAKTKPLSSYDQVHTTKKATQPMPKGQRIDGTNTNDQALGHNEVSYNPDNIVPMVQSFNNPFIAKEEAQRKSYQRSYQNYVPTGTFCRAVLLGGADASAAVDGQSDTSPILFKITNNCTLPNGKHSKLKGAMITASVYGRISSERGEVRLENISLIHKDGTILDMPVEGTAFDIGGKNGIRGIPVLRNGKIIEMSAASGFLSGIGGAISQSSQTTSTSALGSTTTLTGGDVFKAGLGQGAETALGKIADYYIKLAEQYSPIIQLNAGAEVDIVFLKGFPIEEEKMIKRYTNAVNTQRQGEKAAKTVQSIQVPVNPLAAQIPKPFSQTQSSSYNNSFDQITQDHLK
ncbi:TraB/VirB10 family protein [Thiotrichales bacterium 19S3-7]|nr:TraB/VirB10 family protein [Thiotrichales bacterium 19S3-7]MCF6802243.1 TraB/VirB10 family protein [Thiotrichales bacterium 19S3-11]